MTDTDRLVRIETKLDVALDTVKDHAKRLRKLEITLASVLAGSGAIALILSGLQ